MAQSPASDAQPEENEELYKVEVEWKDVEPLSDEKETNTH